ncbi:hypothetical protein CCR92_16725, partial [Rhodospirillum rubrum]|nr:hypothetical protein [Rhodospirillum rubrum]
MVSPTLKPAMDADWTLLSVLGKPVVHSHDRLSALLRVHIGQEAQALLAEPVFAEAPAADGGADLRRPIGWRSPRGGALTPLSAAANPGLLRDRFARLEREITALCARLSTQGEAGQSAAESLRLALITPEGGAWLYADHDQPVLVCWGLGRPGQAIAAGAVGALSGAARAAAASAVSGSAAPVAPSPVGGAASPPPAGSPPPAEGAGSSPVAPAPGRRAWIAPALLALALLLLAGWLAWRALTPLAPVIVEAPAEAPADLSRLDDLGRTLAQLDQALGEARLAEDAFQKACVVPPEPTPEPTPAPPAAAPAPQPDPLPDRAEGSPPPPAEAAPPE